MPPPGGKKYPCSVAPCLKVGEPPQMRGSFGFPFNIIPEKTISKTLHRQGERSILPRPGLTGLSHHAAFADGPLPGGIEACRLVAISLLPLTQRAAYLLGNLILARQRHTRSQKYQWFPKQGGGVGVGVPLHLLEGAPHCKQGQKVTSGVLHTGFNCLAHDCMCICAKAIAKPSLCWGQLTGPSPLQLLLLFADCLKRDGRREVCLLGASGPKRTRSTLAAKPSSATKTQTM